MMTHVTVSDICKIMDSFAPKSLAMDWDNVGLMLGHSARKVDKILLALDLTQEVVDQAFSKDVQMIITHHPAIFKKLSHLTDSSWQERLLLNLAEKKIAVYSAHTNFDCAEEGINDVLALKLGLEKIQVLDEETGLGRMGEIEVESLKAFAFSIKIKLSANYVTYADAGQEVKRVAVCGGAGGDLVDLCLVKGVDTLVTGDIKYHTAQDAVFKGLNIIDAGHQATERIAIENLRTRLEDYFAKENKGVKLYVAKESLILKRV